MLDDLILFVARALVDHPDAIELESEDTPRGTVYYLTVDPSDMGKVIGRQGRIAKAFRSLLSIAATREGVRASLEIREA